MNITGALICTSPPLANKWAGHKVALKYRTSVSIVLQDEGDTGNDPLPMGKSTPPPPLNLFLSQRQQ